MDINNLELVLAGASKNPDDDRLMLNLFGPEAKWVRDTARTYHLTQANLVRAIIRDAMNEFERKEKAKKR